MFNIFSENKSKKTFRKIITKTFLKLLNVLFIINFRNYFFLGIVFGKNKRNYYYQNQIFVVLFAKLQPIFHKYYTQNKSKCFTIISRC